MYQLKCPSCEHTETASFVRIGAVATCGACGHAYRVTEAQVTRSVSAGAATANPLRQDAASRAAERPRVDDEGQMVGLSDLSQTLGPTETSAATGGSVVDELASQAMEMPVLPKSAGAADASAAEDPSKGTILRRLTWIKDRLRTRRTP